MEANNRIAVFIDAENVADWLKQGGIDFLSKELNDLGQIIVRRAYGVWSSTQLSAHQANLNKEGFELIHCFHPATGKNSADIQMTVDVMETAWKIENINTFVLVTGDSDFSPLFRRLREMDKEVIGVGRNSTLSECVKSSCSRFIYTDKFVTEKKDELVENKQETRKEQYLKQSIKLIHEILEKESQPLNISVLRAKLILSDSSFNQEELGFKRWIDFLQTIKGDVELTQKGSIWTVSSKKNKQTQNLEQKYKDLLKSNSKHLIEPEKLKFVYEAACSSNHLFSKLIPMKEAVINNLEKKKLKISKSEVNKCFSLFSCTGLVERNTYNNLEIKKLDYQDFLLAIDNYLIIKLAELCNSNKIELKAKEVKKITYSTISKDEIKKLIKQI